MPPVCYNSVKIGGVKKRTFRFAENYASFYFPRTFRFADYTRHSMFMPGQQPFSTLISLAGAMNVVGRWPVMSAIRFMGRKELQLFLPHKRELRPPKWCASMHVCNAWHSMPPEGWDTIVRCYLVLEQQADWGMPFCSTSARRCSREQSCCSMRLTLTPA